MSLAPLLIRKSTQAALLNQRKPLHALIMAQLGRTWNPGCYSSLTLAALITSKTGDNPFVPDTLYLFCGRKTDRIKGLTWERDGFLLLYKRLEKGRFQWPRNESAVQSLTEQQFRWLMEGLTITPKHTVQEITPPQYLG